MIVSNQISTITGSKGSTGVIPPSSNWILVDGTWRDVGVWEDSATWNDGT